MRATRFLTRFPWRDQVALLENPVLNRELLVNLRTNKSFLLMLFYQVVLGVVVYSAWPKGDIHLDMTMRHQENARLVDLFFLFQFVLTSLIAPSFAAGGIAGEKKRKTYEMLLASPIQPQSIVFGKLVASLTHLTILVLSSIPIVMLCLPLGGVSIYEVMVGLFVVLVAMTTFAMISLACSSLFARTAASLTISYLIILMLAGLLIICWYALRGVGQTRINFMLIIIPSIAVTICVLLYYWVAAQMLYPPDVGSEGNQVLDPDQEERTAVGLVIDRTQFPDRLLAPPPATDLMKDHANPVFDKELRSEFFGQGTLMLRSLIQVSMVLAIVLMIGWLFLYRSQAANYVCYVLLFNMLVAPVFSAGLVTSERERQTLDLLLTTPLTPYQIYWGKMLASLRISSVLSLFLLWPMGCAFVLLFFQEYYRSTLTFLAYLIILGLAFLTTSNVGLFCSTLVRRSARSLLASYAIILTLFCAPLVAYVLGRYLDLGDWLKWVTVPSPFAAAVNVPLYLDSSQFSVTTGLWQPDTSVPNVFGYPLKDLAHFGYFCLFSIALNILLSGLSMIQFAARWRVSSTLAN